MTYYLAPNIEINVILKNVNWMRKEGRSKSSGEEEEKIEGVRIKFELGCKNFK